MKDIKNETLVKKTTKAGLLISDKVDLEIRIILTKRSIVQQ